MNKELYKLKQDFLDYWPVEKLEQMTLEEYTNLEKEDSFCYWVEQKTKGLGDIRGGSSYKFGIYKMAETSKTEKGSNRNNNGNYAWHNKYGDTQDAAFNNIKSTLIEIAQLSISNSLKQIDEIDLGVAFKWKIAFLYSDFNVINIFKKDWLDSAAYGFGIAHDGLSMSELNTNILEKKPNTENFFDFSKKLCETYGHFEANEGNVLSAFEKWLKEQYVKKDGKRLKKRSIDAYLSGLKFISRDLLNHNLIEGETLFHIDDAAILNKLKSDYFNIEEVSKANESGNKRFENSFNRYIEFKQTKVNKEIRSVIMEKNREDVTPALNQILYGPPGTGKTYNTINEALKIVDKDFYIENKDNREALTKRFKELLIKKWDENKGQIAFCTFHQSFGYEDFVEGIKPKVNNNKEVYYNIENGVFKNICDLADSSLSTLKIKKEDKLGWDKTDFDHARFYKLSLGDSQKSEDREIYEYSRDHNCIAIGFGDDIDFTGLNESAIKQKLEDSDYKDSSAQMINCFIHLVKNGDYVLISNGNQYVRALGKVTGDYEYNPDAPIRYNHFRKVEWVFTDENIPIEELYEVGMSQRTIYKIDDKKLKPEFFIDQGSIVSEAATTEKKYVLIIDEINRGNVSSIFGELITLIETDKRAGKPEELEVVLPYSKLPFKVPHNVYIIGTMNTADRSIESLDTALRRRFSFKEMPPKPQLILIQGKSSEVNGEVDKINLKHLLETINKRIEKLIDKDHKIGHSYFLKVNDKSSLVSCFENEVIPLLEEYFFGDFGKIGLVLGNSFIAKDDTNNFEFAEFDGYDADVSDDLKLRSVYKIANSENWNFNTI